MNFADNAKMQFLNWLRANNPQAYQRAVAAQNRGMGATGDEDTWYGSLFKTVAGLGSTLYGSKIEADRAKQAEKLIIEQNKLEAARAQQAAVNTIQQREYGEQMAELQRMQMQTDQAQMDTLLMVAGVALAGLVGAKLLKVI